MWHFISEHIGEATGALFVCQHRAQAHGGDIHQCFIIRDETRRFFVKFCPQQTDSVFAPEIDGLHAIEATNTVLTPKVICHGVTPEAEKSQEYLVLAFMRFSELEDHWTELGALLAAMHKAHTGNTFGWPTDNLIGRTPQINTQRSQWAQFYAENRIGYQLECLARQGHQFVSIDDIVSEVQSRLSSHQPVCSLLHGDLWSGNVGMTKRGAVIYDPAVYIGDRETDIAMTELFGGFPAHFYDAYRHTWPLPDDYPERRQLYQLYHLLNHAVMFGDHYLSDAKSAIIRLQSS